MREDDLRRSPLPGANRTKVGLKHPRSLGRASRTPGANRTKVGLKPAGIHGSAPSRGSANRTKVGLKLLSRCKNKKSA